MAKISDETYGQLQRILERQNIKNYTLEEAKEISNGLIDFLLALNEIKEQLDDLI